MSATIEYALMIDWEDGTTEYVPAENPEHAARMAKTIYAHRPCWTVGRPVNPWRYVNLVGTVTLTHEVAR